MKSLLTTTLSILISLGLLAQITSDPAFPQQTETVTIVFDANKGNAALYDYEGPVYLHTGLITSESEHILDWQHTVTEWNSAEPALEMNSLGNGLYSKTININNFYGVLPGETVHRMAFLFRDANGGKVARATDGSDFFLEVYPPGLFTRFLQPTEPGIFLDIDETYTVEAAASETDQMSLSIDGQQIYAINNNYFDYDISFDSYGKYWVTLEAGEGVLAVADSFYVMVQQPVNIAELPDGIEDGINILPDNTVILSLYAPGKDYAYVLADWNNWELDPDSYMNRTPDGNRFWLEVNGLQGSQEYFFQYFVDGQIKIADPYSTKVLDPAFDAYINPLTYPGLATYPYGRTSGVVTSFRLTPTSYQWNANDFTRRPADELVIYQIHPGEFTDVHTYEALIDRLDYIQSLNVNTIALMPICEFEGNENWGHNTTYYLAADKFYGPSYNLKRFIDECHLRNIAVVMDMNFDHSSELSPLAQLYWNYNLQDAASDSPWFNSESPHFDGRKADFNFSKPAASNFFERVLNHWSREFRIDGFRFIKSSGFTQKQSGSPLGLEEEDPQRTANMQALSDMVTDIQPDLYVIFDQVPNNTEAAEMSASGNLVMADLADSFLQIARGEAASLSDASYLDRGFNQPHSVVSAQSVSSQNLMYESLNEGNAQGDYDLQDFQTAIKKMQQIAVFLLAFPGPKHIQQFQELAFDRDYDNPCLECPQPTVWPYLEAEPRQRLMQTYMSMLQLREQEPAFQSDNFNLYEAGTYKQLTILDASMDVNLVGNVGTAWDLQVVNFPSPGVWYEYFSGDSILVPENGFIYNFEPGEFQLFTSKLLQVPYPDLVSFDSIYTEPTSNMLSQKFNWQCYPNPAAQQMQYEIYLPGTTALTITLLDMTGSKVQEVAQESQAFGRYAGELWREQLAAGIYFLEVNLGGQGVYYEKVVWQ